MGKKMLLLIPLTIYLFLPTVSALSECSKGGHLIAADNRLTINETNLLSDYHHVIVIYKNPEEIVFVFESCNMGCVWHGYRASVLSLLPRGTRVTVASIDTGKADAVDGKPFYFTNSLTDLRKVVPVPNSYFVKVQISDYLKTHTFQSGLFNLAKKERGYIVVDRIMTSQFEKILCISRTLSDSFFPKDKKNVYLWNFTSEKLNKSFFQSSITIILLFLKICGLIIFDIAVIGLISFCTIVAILEKKLIPLLIPLLSISISYFIFRLGDLFHTDVYSARYMLSALVQSEAAIIAIVITLSLVAVQLTASSYSPRVTQIFRNSRGLWILVGSYTFAILYTLCVLKMVESTIESRIELHITLCYFVGIFCLTALIPYICNMFTMLQTSKIIEILSQKITKDNLIKEDTTEGKIIEEDPIQPIIDLVRGSIMKYDYETARDGLTEIREKVCLIFEENPIEEEEKDISKTVSDYFSTVGKLAVNRGDKDLGFRVILNIKKIGEVAIEKGLREASLETVSSLGEIGISATKRDLEEVAFEAALYLGEFGNDVVEKSFEEVAKEVVSILGEIGKDAVKKGLGDVLFEVIFYLGEVGTFAVKKGFEEVAWEIVSSLGDIGITVAKRGLKEEAWEIVSILRRIGETAVEEHLEKVVWEIVSILRRIGETAVEEHLEKVVWEIVSSLGEIGKTAVEKDLEKVVWEIVSSLGEIGKTAVEKDLEEEAWETVLALRRLEMATIEKGFEKATSEAIFYLGEIGIAAAEENLEKVAKEVASILGKVGITAIRKDLKKIVHLAASSLGEIGITATEKGFEEIAQVVYLAASSLGEIGITAVKKDLIEEAWEVVSILREVQVAAVEENLREEAQKVVSILEKIAKIVNQKGHKNVALEIEQHLNEIRGSTDNSK